jgi:hypothetical protein
VPLFLISPFFLKNTKKRLSRAKEKSGERARFATQRTCRLTRALKGGERNGALQVRKNFAVVTHYFLFGCVCFMCLANKSARRSLRLLASARKLVCVYTHFRNLIVRIEPQINLFASHSQTVRALLRSLSLGRQKCAYGTKCLDIIEKSI